MDFFFLKKSREISIRVSHIRYLNTIEPTSPYLSEQYLRDNGFPAYTTSVGWKGYSDEKIRTLCKQALKDGWTR